MRGRPPHILSSVVHRSPEGDDRQTRPMFDAFRKTRPVLPEDIRCIYVTHCKEKYSGRLRW
jgi:hypothetical protein